MEVDKSPFAAAMESSMFVADATNNRPDGQEVLEDIEAIMPEKSPMSGVLIEDEDDNHDNDTISQKNEDICQQCKKYSQRIRDLEKQLEIGKLFFIAVATSTGDILKLFLCYECIILIHMHRNSFS